MAYKHIWTGKFLDGKLHIFCEESKPSEVHYKVISYDVELEGMIPSPEIGTDREKMEAILQEIQEQYILAVLAVKEDAIKNYGFSLQ